MDVSRPVLMTLILHFLTSHPLKRTLILAKNLTSDPYNLGSLKRRKSVESDCIHLQFDFYYLQRRRIEGR